MGLTTEKLAAKWKVPREEQDAFALASHRKALAAQAAGEFDAEISPIDVTLHRPAPEGSRAIEEIAHGRARRRTARRHDGRGSREAEAGLRCQGQRHCGQQLADVRRRRGGDRRRRACVAGSRSRSARALAWLRGRGRAAGVHGHRSGEGGSDGAAHRRHPAAGRRLDRAERGLRRPEPRGDARPRPRSCQGQSTGRGDRARPSARRDRRRAHRDHRPRHAPPRTEVRRRHHVRRDRHGRRGRIRVDPGGSGRV